MRSLSPLLLLGLVGCRNVIPDRTPLAPPFEGESSTGQSLRMLDLSRDRDLLVVFFVHDGPVGKGALSVAKVVQERMGADALAVVGATDQEAPKIKGWARESSVPVMSDAGARIAMRYKARISPTFQIIGKGGTWGPKVEGCDATSMAELEAALKLKAGTLKDLAIAEAKDKQNIW